MGKRNLIPFVDSRRLAWAIVGVLALIIAVLSLTPEPEKIISISLWDKLSHFLAYGTLALTLGHALAVSGWTRGSLIVVGIVLSTAYGGLMEGLQYFSPPRTPELMDAFSNLLGSCAGMASFVLLNSVRVRLERQE